MQVIRDRKQFALAVNFGKYPVVYAVPQKDDFGWSLGKVRIDVGREYFGKAELRIYSDERRLTTSSHGTMLSAQWGYHDAVRDAQFASAPVLKPNSQFILVMDLPRERNAITLLVDTGRVDLNCSTPLHILDADMEPVLDAMGMTAELCGAGE